MRAAPLGHRPRARRRSRRRRRRRPRAAAAAAHPAPIASQVYEGQYHDGMMHGRGKYTFADGTVDHDGEWAEDDPVDEDGYPIEK